MNPISLETAMGLVVRLLREAGEYHDDHDVDMLLSAAFSVDREHELTVRAGILPFDHEAGLSEADNQRFCELTELVRRGFLVYALKGNLLCDRERTTETYSRLQNCYPGGSKQFNQFARAYVSLKMLVEDLVETDRSLAITEMFVRIEFAISCVFFPMGQVIASRDERTAFFRSAGLDIDLSGFPEKGGSVPPVGWPGVMLLMIASSLFPAAHVYFDSLWIKIPAIVMALLVFYLVLCFAGEVGWGVVQFIVPAWLFMAISSLPSWTAYVLGLWQVSMLITIASFIRRRKNAPMTERC